MCPAAARYLIMVLEFLEPSRAHAQQFLRGKWLMGGQPGHACVVRGAMGWYGYWVGNLVLRMLWVMRIECLGYKKTMVDGHSKLKRNEKGLSCLEAA